MESNLASHVGLLSPYFRIQQESFEYNNHNNMFNLIRDMRHTVDQRKAGIKLRLPSSMASDLFKFIF